MASPGRTSWAQDVIICNLCDNPALRFCNSCQADLCLDCVGKHLRKYESVSHDIVSFKNRKIKPVLPECELHPGQRCEVHCQQCQTPVCVMCCIGQHKGHDAVELTEVLESKKEEIKKEAEEIEAKLIPEYIAADTETKLKMSTLTEEFAQKKQEIKKLRKIWHQEVEKIFNKADELINSMKEISLDCLAVHQNEITERITEMKQTVQQHQQILKSNKASEINAFRSKLREYKEIPKEAEVYVPSLITDTTRGRKLRMEIDTFKANLSQESLLSVPDVSIQTGGNIKNEANVISTISSYHNSLWRIVCVGSDEAWISGVSELIRKIDMHGSVQDTITISCDDWPNDIAVTAYGELIYSGSTSKTVKMIRNGKIKTLITTPRGWAPGGLCFSRSGQTLLVNLSNGKRNKILRYHDRKIIQTIDKDEYGNNIFKKGGCDLLMTENSNEDICVSDLNACIVIVVDTTGEVRFRYDGTHVWRKRSFSPRCIATDSLSQIIVSDFNNDCLHILDQDGNFLKIVDNCGLYEPIGLSVDTKGRLWVGLCETGEIKIIQDVK